MIIWLNSPIIKLAGKEVTRTFASGPLTGPGGLGENATELHKLKNRKEETVMAEKQLIRSRLSLVYNIGEDEDGRTITQRSGYETKTDANADALHAVGVALASLSEFPVIELSLAETSFIA
ncbi:Protein of unknown function [Alteribacillus iranensis]|uniref:DUF1659 domain-containing protein n=1 Tax=Alteribacillus iranensis TaxID=930128 RepID=A0A1I2BTQ6_9BACI|nr:Protein of unknown function [Alteribacillus iranensis]